MSQATQAPNQTPAPVLVKPNKLKRSPRIPVATRFWGANISSLHQLVTFLTNQQAVNLHGGFEGIYLEPFEDERQTLYQLEIIFRRPITAPTMDVRGIWEPIDEITPGDIRISGGEDDPSSDESTDLEDMVPDSVATPAKKNKI